METNQKRGETVLPYELTFLQWLQGFRSPFWNGFWEGVTLLGEDTLMIILVAAIYFLWDKKLAYRLCFLTVTSLGLNGILKNLAKIPRPFAAGEVTCVRPETATGYSFPSGHTQNFTTWSMVLADYFKQYRWVALVLALLMGFSRLYLGAHYPSDVITAIVLGVLLSIMGNRIYDRVEHHQTLHLTVLGIFTPFVIFFLCRPDPLFEDFFKCYGLLGGFYISVFLEERFANLSPGVSFGKKLVRMVLGIALALLLKAGIALAYTPNQLVISLIWDCFRYFILVVIIFGIYPIILKKCNL